MLQKKRRLDEEIDAILGGGSATSTVDADIDAILAEPSEASVPIASRSSLPSESTASRIQSGLESIITPVAREAWGVLKPPDIVTKGIGAAAEIAYRPVSALGAYAAGKLSGEPEAITAAKVGTELLGTEGAKKSGFAPAAKQVLDAAVEYGVTKGLLGDKNIIDQAVKEGKPLSITVPKGIPYAGGKTVAIPPEYLLSIPAEIAVPADLGLAKALKALRAGKAARAIAKAERIVPEEIIQREGSLAKAIETPVEARKAPPVSRAAQPPIVPETPVVSGVEARGGEAGGVAGTEWGSSNRIVTAEAADAARVRLKAKEGGTLMGSAGGLDPIYIKDLAVLGAYHLEAGAREFGAWSAKMLAETGDWAKPYLKQVWNEIHKQSVPPQAAVGAARVAAATQPRAGAGAIPPVAQTPPTAPAPPTGAAAGAQAAVQDAQPYIRFGGPKTTREPMADRLHRWWNERFNDLHQWRRFEEPIAKEAGIAEGDRGYTMARVSRGWPGIAEEWLKKGGPSSYVDPMMDLGIPSLDNIVKTAGDAGITPEQLGTFMAAARAGELEAWGFKTGIPMEKAAAWIDELNSQPMRDAAQQVDRTLDAARQFLVDTGLISPEAKAGMEAKYMFYVPMERVIEESGEGMNYFDKFSDLPSAVKSMHGSERQTIDPLETIYKNIALYINLGTKNAAASRLVDILEASPRGAELIRKIPPNVHAPAGMNTTTILRNGVRTTYAVDDRLFSAMKNLHRRELDEAWKILSVPAQVQRAGITLGTEFPQRNIVRDIPAAIIQTAMNPIDVMRGVAAMLDDARKGSGGSNEAMRLYRLSGGQQAFQSAVDRSSKDIAGHLARMTKVRGPYGMVIEQAKHPIDLWRRIAGVGEQPARVGAHIAYGRKAKGYTDRGKLFEGGLSSRESSVDFAVRGAKMQGWNAGRAFLGASMGAMRQTVKTMGKHPVRTNIMGVTGLTVPTIALYLAQRDDGRYNEVSDVYKDTGWVFLDDFVSKEDWSKLTPEQKAEFNKDRPVTWIPYPHSYGAVYAAIPRRFLEYMDNNRPELLDDYWRLMNMVGIDSPMPSALQTGKDILQNRSDWSGKKIEPEPIHKLEPKSERKTEWTTPLGVALSRLTGGLLSPIQADYTIGQLGGSVGRLAQDVTREGQKGEPTTRLREQPGLRAFSVRMPSGMMEPTSEVQRLSKEATEAHDRVLARLRRGEPGEPDKTGKTVREIMEDADRLSGITKQIGAIYDEMRQIRKDDSLTPDVKRDKIDALYFKMSDMAKEELERRKKEKANAPR